jgi:hypothetical protein
LTFFAIAALLVVTVVSAEFVFPGRDLYHAGWFNVALITLAIGVIASARSQFERLDSQRARIGVIAVALGAAIAGTAGAASGLFAPDNHTIVGAPGQRIRVDGLAGSLVFPIAAVNGVDAGVTGDVVLERVNRRFPLGSRGRIVGTFVLRTTPRDVVYVDARDARGGGLTITQPSGASFLSPVLLMQQRQSIAGLDVPFDSFAVPAAHRLVKAVRFTSEQADMMRGLRGGSGPAVLFAVDDESDRPLPGAIAAVRTGATAEAGGLQLRAVVFAYPAVDVVAIPSLFVTVAGALLVLGGLTLRYTGSVAGVSS